MSWVYSLIAGIFEMVWAVGLKFSQGFSRLVPSVVTIGGLVASFVFLDLALRRLPLGTSYAVWTGIGIIGTSIAGIVLFGESLTLPHLICIACIAAGIIGLKLIG